jgi:hypothetical protein
MQCIYKALWKIYVESSHITPAVKRAGTEAKWQIRLERERRRQRCLVQRCVGMSVVNWAMKSWWLNCRGEHLSRFCWKAYVRGLWSVKIVKWRASSIFFFFVLRSQFICNLYTIRDTSSVVVKAVCYKLEGRGFDTRWGEFLIYLNLPAALGPGVYLPTNRNEYQKHKNNNVCGE